MPLNARAVDETTAGRVDVERDVARVAIKVLVASGAATSCRLDARIPEAVDVNVLEELRQMRFHLAVDEIHI